MLEVQSLKRIFFHNIEKHCHICFHRLLLPIFFVSFAFNPVGYSPCPRHDITQPPPPPHSSTSTSLSTTRRSSQHVCRCTPSAGLLLCKDLGGKRNISLFLLKPSSSLGFTVCAFVVFSKAMASSSMPSRNIIDGKGVMVGMIHPQPTSTVEDLLEVAKATGDFFQIENKDILFLSGPRRAPMLSDFTRTATRLFAFGRSHSLIVQPREPLPPTECCVLDLQQRRETSPKVFW